MEKNKNKNSDMNIRFAAELLFYWSSLETYGRRLRGLVEREYCWNQDWEYKIADKFCDIMGPRIDDEDLILEISLASKDKGEEYIKCELEQLYEWVESIL